MVIVRTIPQVSQHDLGNVEKLQPRTPIYVKLPQQMKLTDARRMQKHSVKKGAYGEPQQ
jgi:hypothetical protein